MNKYLARLLDDESGSEVLLRIEDRLSESCRYLVFKWQGRSGSWKLLGHVDHDFGKYRMPQHLIVLSNGRPWLVIRGQGGSGSGVALYFDSLTNEGSLKYNFKELSRLAHEAGKNTKEWLKRFLEVCKDTEEKRRLRVLLASS